MPRTCAVIDCLKTAKDNVSLFAVAHHAKSAQYQAFLEKANAAYNGFWKTTKGASICSVHFVETDVEILPSMRCKIREDALPTLVNGKEIITKDELVALAKPFTTESVEYELCDSKEPCVQDNDYIVQLKSTIREQDKTIGSLRSKLQKKTELVDRYQKELALYRQRDKRKDESNKRKSSQQNLPPPAPKRLTSNRLSEQALGILNELEVRGEMPVNTPFSQRLREFAFEINYYSPRSYEKCRDTITTLPNPSSFQNWTRHITVAPGFISSSFDFIRKRTEESTHKLYYALSVDEVHIRKQIVHTQGRFIGYIDYGNMADSVFTEKEATAALFVMATEINGHHKIPLGYILTNGLKKEVLRQVIERTILRMRNENANVLTVTFDGLPANSKAVELLGADLSVMDDDFMPFIPGPTQKDNVHIILDACHMLKLFRNLFKEYGVLINERGAEICWLYIMRLLELQDKEGLRAANKITVRHVHYQNQKMKTKLAAQTLRGSSAISLRFVRSLNIPGFELTQATEEFLTILNLLFDYLNSITKGVGARAPLRWSKYAEVTDFFVKTRRYLLSLKWRHFVDGKIVESPLVTSPRSTAIKGLLITMRSLELIMVNVLSDPLSDLKYLPTFKVSQDPLENLFSSLRSRFGFNNNPNALQLQHAVKGMLCMKTKALSTGNCLEQEETLTKICPLSSIKTLGDDNPILSEDAEDNCYDFDIDLSTMTQYVSNVAFYISGFVVRKLMKRLRCHECIMKLHPTEEDIPKISSDSVLTCLRDRGGLFYPSYSVLSVCKIVEQIIRIKESDGLHKLKEPEVLAKVVHECFEKGLASSMDCGAKLSLGLDSGHAVQLIRQISSYYCSSRFKLTAHNATRKMNPISNRNSNNHIVKVTAIE